MSSIQASQLRPEMVARIKRENPSVRELTGPVLETEKYIPSWGAEALGRAGKLIAIAPQALEAEEKRFPEVANLVRQAEKAVFATLPLEGAVVGLLLGEADGWQDNHGITSVELLPLSLNAPYVGQEPVGMMYMDHHANQAYIHLTADKVAVPATSEPGTATKARDMAVLQTLRDLFEEAGGRLAGAPTDAHQRGRASQGKLILNFDYGSPQTLSTPSGNYEFASNSTRIGRGGTDRFMELLHSVFDVKVLEEKRDDSIFHPHSYKFQNEHSGPVVELTPKNEASLAPFRGFPESMKTPEGFSPEAAERVLESFLHSPGASDRALSNEEAQSLQAMVTARRDHLEALDRGDTNVKGKDTDPRPGFVEWQDFDTVRAELKKDEVKSVEISRYIGETVRIGRKTENGLVGIELEGRGRYAEGLAFEITPAGARTRELFFKETLEGKF